MWFPRVNPIQPKPADPRDSQRLNHHLAIADALAHAQLVQSNHDKLEAMYREALESYSDEV